MKRRLADRVVSLDGLTEGLSSRTFTLLTDRLFEWMNDWLNKGKDLLIG